MIERAIPHLLGMSVWGFRSPLQAGSDFEVIIGAKCNGSCDLSGRRITILDESSTMLATSRLDDLDERDKESRFYKTSIPMKVPAETRIHVWKVRFDNSDFEYEHEGTEHDFMFTVIDKLFRTINVKIVDMETREPIQSASVSFVHEGWVPYEQRTNEMGLAEIQVPDGEYQINIAKIRYTINRVAVVVENENAYFEIPLRRY
jgi:hypothetical protein